MKDINPESSFVITEIHAVFSLVRLPVERSSKFSYATLTSLAISSGYGKHVPTLTLEQTTKQLKAGFNAIFLHFL